MPFVQRKFTKTVLDYVAFLGFLGSAVVSKVRAWDERGGALDDDVFAFTMDDSPLIWLVSDRQSSSS